MEYKTEFSFPVTEELSETLGIDEDTAFETYYKGGRIRIRVLDDDEFEDIEDNEDLSIPEKCVSCPNYCWHCKKCTIDI